MLSFDAAQLTAVGLKSKEAKWVFTVTDKNAVAYEYATGAIAGVVNDIVLMDFSGIDLRRNQSETGIIAPSDVTFNISNPGSTLVFSDFKSGSVLIDLYISTSALDTKMASWLFRIKTAEPGYQNIKIVAEDFLQFYLRGDYPNTRLPADIFPSERSYENDGLCLPVPFGTAYVPLRDVYIDGAVTITAATIGAVASVAGARCQFTDSANGFLAAGIEQGRTITVSGFLTNAANNGDFQVLSVTAGVIEVEIDAGLVTEVALEAITITHGSGYIMLGSPAGGITYAITKVRSPRAWGQKSEYAGPAAPYVFNQYTKADVDAVNWRVFQAIIADIDSNGTADAPGFWMTDGGPVLDPLVQFTRSDTDDMTNPADIIAFVLEDMGVPTGNIDDGVGSSFATAHATFDSYAKETAPELMPNLVDRDFSGASAWTDNDLVSNGGTYDETGDLSIHSHAINADCFLPVASAPTTIGKTYKLTVSVANLHATWRIYDFSGTQLLTTIVVDGVAQEHFFTATTAGGFRIISDATDAVADFDDFSLKESGLEFNGAFWYKQPREKVLAQLLNMCHACLDVGDKIKMRVLDKDTQKIITAAEILRPGDVGEGSFQYRDLCNDNYSDSGYVAWQQAGEPQDSFLKVLVAADAAANVISKDVLDCPFVQDSRDVQRIGKLYYQRRFLREAEVAFLAKGTCLALQPDDVIEIAHANYGGTYKVLIDSVRINKDLSIQFGCSKFTAVAPLTIPFDDWADLAPDTLVIPEDDTAYAWQPTVSGPQTDQDIGRSAFDVWGKEYLTVGPTTNAGKFTDIQKAFNACKQAGAGSIYILNGNYQATAPWYVPDVNLEVVGQSQGGVVLKNLAGSDLFVLHNLTKTFSFKQFSIASQNVATFSKMFNIYGDTAAENSANITIENILKTLAAATSTADHEYGIYAEKGTGIIRALNNRILNGLNAMLLIDCATLVIEGNKKLSAQYGNPIYLTGAIVDASVNGNILQNVRAHGIVANMPAGTLMANGNSITYVTTNAVDANTYGIVVYGKAIVSENGIIMAHTKTANASAAILANSVGMSKLSQNIISMALLSQSNDPAIQIIGSNCEVLGNSVVMDLAYAAYHWGIYIVGDLNIVSHNSLDLKNATAWNIGIALPNGSDNNKGQGNLFYRCGKNITDLGTGNLINKSGGGTF